MYAIYTGADRVYMLDLHTCKHSENTCIIYIHTQTEVICKIDTYRHSENICMIYIQGQTDRGYMSDLHT